ncbi:zinc-binding dehydrogenase [Microbacterium sp. X-17]|uniref:zinc-dependent alcohol dehydrogenase n=1 Tax=Microbacterium sp. X-17 TaxID=3144404 RepID=UPI0031F53066
MKSSMWALRLTGPSQLAMDEAPAPTAAELRPGEVMIRSLAGGVCGSDLPFFQGRPFGAPLPGGPHAPGFSLHEVAGEVLASADDSIEVGEHVVGWATANDGLAEFVVSRGSSLHSYSKQLKASTAIMIQPLACVIHAVNQIGDVAGRSSAVLGLGPIGVLFAHVLKSRGAASVVGVDRVNRSDVGPSFGIDEVVHAHTANWALELRANEQADIVVEAIGHQVETMTSAMQAVAEEGRVFYFGIPNDEVYPLPINLLLRKNATLKAGYTPEKVRRHVLADAEDYLAGFPEIADAYLTSPYSYASAEEAFIAATRPASGQMKVTFGLD